MKKIKYIAIFAIFTFTLLSCILLTINISISNEINGVLNVFITIDKMTKESIDFYRTSQIVVLILNIFVLVYTIFILVKISYNNYKAKAITKYQRKQQQIAKLEKQLQDLKKDDK